ncbi:MAG: asparagine synthase (glutamine-hydrolyzing) [Sphingosinicella sp.]|nr:asparagine synthase (glutamine-hydrolyzing) [Sphingosinicella sp.]
MCGIIGSIFRKSGYPPAPDLSCLAHRGPDAEGLVSYGNVQLGHTRLSIIDLAAGAQPMADIADLAIVTFNGEIYNHGELRSELAHAGHVFATRSDTEVILAAYLVWGLAGFARLRGMYAFALHDRRDGKTILVRDPFGIKPLFWMRDGRGIHFASEQEALLTLCEKVPEVDMTSVLELLQHRYVMGEGTLYKGVSRLEQGTALIVSADAENMHFHRFVSLADEVEKHRDSSNTDLSEQVRQRMADSVAHHMVSDVPVGVFLSGGLDSSIVAYCAGELNNTARKAFSIGFEGAETEASELPYARSVASRVGMDLHEVLVSADDFVSLAPILSGTLNGPFADPADIAMLKLSKTAAQFVKVVLSGEGSDEALAGYPKYAVDGYSHGFGGVMRLADLCLGRRGKIGIAADALAESDPALRWMRWFQNDASPQGLLQGLIRQGADTDRASTWVRDRVKSYPADWSNIQRMQLLDLESWLPNNLLHRGDFTTMRASIEQRVPFLDMGITPWAVGLSDKQKIRGLQGKMPLRRAYEAVLPPEVVSRKKADFVCRWASGCSPTRTSARSLMTTF